MSESIKDEKDNTNGNNTEMLNKKTYRTDPERETVRQKHLDEYILY